MLKIGLIKYSNLRNAFEFQSTVHYTVHDIEVWQLILNQVSEYPFWFLKDENLEVNNKRWYVIHEKACSDSVC